MHGENLTHCVRFSLLRFDDVCGRMMHNIQHISPFCPVVCVYAVNFTTLLGKMSGFGLRFCDVVVYSAT